MVYWGNVNTTRMTVVQEGMRTDESRVPISAKGQTDYHESQLSAGGMFKYQIWFDFLSAQSVLSVLSVEKWFGLHSFCIAPAEL